MSRRTRTDNNNSLVSFCVATWWSWWQDFLAGHLPFNSFISNVGDIGFSTLLRTSVGTLFTLLPQDDKFHWSTVLWQKYPGCLHWKMASHQKRTGSTRGRKRKRQISCKCVDRSGTNGETKEGERRNRKLTGKEGGKVTRFAPPSARRRLPLRGKNTKRKSRSDRVLTLNETTRLASL